jgi:hypothetical protein
MKLSEVIRRTNYLGEGIELGEGNGTLAFDQLNELIPSNLGPEDTELVLFSLSAKNILVES